MSARRVLITGVTGQDGSYLAEQLLAEGCHVVGMARSAPPTPGEVEVLRGDLLDPASLRAVVERARPDELYHLAAPTFVPASWEQPADVFAAIAGATAVLLELALRGGFRVWVATSSEVFGDAGESPQTERSPMRPASPYGVAKLAALGLVRVMRERHGLHASAGLLYNHESPRRPPRFLPRKVSMGAAAIALGRQERLELGSLDAVRDWCHAADVARAARLAVRHDEPGDYVVASGQGRTVRELVAAAFAAAGVDPAGRVVVAPEFLRPPEPTASVGDASLARERLGWRPEISFEAMVAEMVAHDLALLRG